MPAAAAEWLLGLGVLVAIALGASALVTARAGRRPPPAPPPRRSFEAAPSDRSLQNVGVVRFNPYHDTGGDYSFAVALLDGTGNGVILTGLYHRDRCRVYAKPVQGWTSSYTLTDEEVEAVEQARQRG